MREFSIFDCQKLESATCVYAYTVFALLQRIVEKTDLRRDDDTFVAFVDLLGCLVFDLDSEQIVNDHAFAALTELACEIFLDGKRNNESMLRLLCRLADKQLL